MKTIKDIDVTFDFTTDSPSYWDHFWENKKGLGIGISDPDSESQTLQTYHKILYSRVLPNGEIMDLKTGSESYYYLTWKNFRFGSDSITASFRYYDYIDMIEKVKSSLSDYKQYMEDFLRKSYTIGGNIIFPKRPNSINQKRGCESKIRDRWDLTLECIRRFYNKEDSPLTRTLEKDMHFFDLFIDFKGYVDFFFLQDCVTEDYSQVKFFIDTKDFEDNPFPKTVEDYLCFIENQLNFVSKRNERIKIFISNNT